MSQWSRFRLRFLVFKGFGGFMSITLAPNPRSTAPIVLIASVGNDQRVSVEIFTLTRNPHSSHYCPWFT